MKYHFCWTFPTKKEIIITQTHNEILPLVIKVLNACNNSCFLLKRQHTTYAQQPYKSRDTQSSMNVYKLCSIISMPINVTSLIILHSPPPRVSLSTSIKAGTSLVVVNVSEGSVVKKHINQQLI